METTRVDICYRPLRIAWAIHSADHEAFRDAVRFTHTLWGGRFNPIVMVDRPEEAQAIVELFRADVIIPVGESEQVNEFAKRFPHLITPFFPNTFKEMREATSAQVLDIHNALDSWRDTPEWKANSVLLAMPKNTPEKLALAKMKQMIKRGIVSGCPCGCRGDFEITAKGQSELFNRNPGE